MPLKFSKEEGLYSIKYFKQNNKKNCDKKSKNNTASVKRKKINVQIDYNSVST